MSKGWDFDLEALHGQQETTDEDRAYKGSRYSEVRKALYANPYRGGTSGQAPGPLPMFRSTIRNAWRGTLHGHKFLKEASARTIDTRSDLRWGTDGRDSEDSRPNGIACSGRGRSRRESVTGTFRKGAKGADIGRIS